MLLNASLPAMAAVIGDGELPPVEAPDRGNGLASRWPPMGQRPWEYSLLRQVPRRLPKH